MSWKDEVLSNFMDSDGLVTLSPIKTPWSTGNGLLYTGLFMVCCGLTGVLDSSDRLRFVKATLGCQVVPGVYNRNPGRPDWEAPDDYVGVAAGSYFAIDPRAHEILSHGESHDWCYDNTDPAKLSLKACHARFPGRRGFYYAAARERVGFFLKLGVNSGVRGSMSERDPGSHILTWLQVKVLEREKVCLVVCEEFNQFMREQYGSIGGLLKRSWAVTSHPLFEVGVV